MCHSTLQYARLQMCVSTAHMTDVPEKLPSMAGVNAGLAGNVRMDTRNTELHLWYRGADKFLARPGRKQAAATEDFDVHISYLLS